MGGIAKGAGLALAIVVAGAGAGHAASVTEAFRIQVTTGSGPDGADVSGTVFDGSVTYDDATVVGSIGGGFETNADLGALMTLAFIDRTITEADSDISSEPEIDFDATGTIVGLFFSVDVPNAFFISFSGDTFSYDYSEIVEVIDIGDPDDPFDDEVFFEPRTIARGEGVLLGDTPAVPLPASALLLLGGLGLLGAVRRR